MDYVRLPFIWCNNPVSAVHACMHKSMVLAALTRVSKAIGYCRAIPRRATSPRNDLRYAVAVDVCTGKPLWHRSPCSWQHFSFTRIESRRNWLYVLHDVAAFDGSFAQVASVL